MAFVTPTSRTTNEFITAAIWNQDCVDNPIAIRAGEIATASQEAGHFLITTNATTVSSISDDVAKLFVEVFS